jgi:transcriptional regulator with XRE-family HTH domain
MDHDDKHSNYEEFLEGIDRMKDQAKGETDFLEGISALSGDTSAVEEPGPVGDRVKNIREKKGLTLKDVASRTGFDVNYLGRIENNEVSPPLGVLIKLSKALDMKMGFFISGGETKPYTVVRESERKKISRRASSDDKAYGYTYEALAPGKTDRHMEPFLVTLEPSEKEELSTHDGQEFIYVLDGQMEAILGEDRVVLNAGDCIYYDSTLPHMVRCVGGQSTKVLAVMYTNGK